MKPQPETSLREIRFAAFDLETTGMDPIRDKIVEIGVVFFSETDIKGTLELLVNPGIPIPKVALDIHGIDDAMVRDQPDVSAVLPQLLSSLSEAVPVAHNVSFDLAFLLEAARLESLAFFPNPIVDTCMIARQVFPKLPNHRLQSLVTEFNLTKDQSHRALSDAKSCFSLFCRIVEDLPLKWDTPWSDFQAKLSGIFSADGHGFAIPENMSYVEKALEERRRLTVSYKDGKGLVTKREVTPMAITRDDHSRMVMLGYCHLRQGTRTFRFDRIMGMALSD